MKLFRKKQPLYNPRQEELADSIAGCIIRWQTRIAGYLNNSTKDLSDKTRLMLFILFCVLLAAINLYLLIHSI